MTTATLGAVSRRFASFDTRTLPLAGSFIVLALQFSLVFTRAINWDEFYYYAEVERFANGQLERGLQTIHTRLFEWLTLLPGSEVDRIVAGRIVMFACEIITVASIAAIARRFADQQTALLCALAYLSAGFVLQHGFSFRTDPLAAALLTSAMAILVRSRMNAWSILVFGLLTGWSLMVTIKVALYLPAFAGLAWLRWRDANGSAAMAMRIALAGTAGLAVFGITYLLHSSGITKPDAPQAAAMIGASGSKMFSLGVPPYWFIAVKAVLFAMPLALLILLVPGRLREKSRPLSERIALAGLIAPVLTPLFYHNTAPYYYAFMLPPVAAACAVSIPLVLKRYAEAFVALILTANAVFIWSIDGESRIDKQRQILEMADTMFPSGTTYFDMSYMLPTFTKGNGFMTPWGMEIYRNRGVPIYAQAMAKGPVPLVVENDPMLTSLLRSDAPTGIFLPKDEASVRGSYVHYWGPLWLAGQQLEAGETRRVELRVPGPYTVNGGPVTVNGKMYRDGQTITLVRGAIKLSALSEESELLWGEDRSRTDKPELEGLFWTGF
ncbi:ArnT family glycosyltransferase [Allopontixanthobacter sediminis]|uniref:Dolichyl-phosphate-mannose-protein mannosyltransferase n=1 Tax=Allopontixanthobacter sediminis TaxID=1689985 RepID=A0A845B579_9SPHN|nr:hypothetical protein [Allopontixanthobacter sediminis]MXP45306.1 hypothetical protein [Allopontixanthobacter sediminis]